MLIYDVFENNSQTGTSNANIEVQSFYGSIIKIFINIHIYGAPATSTPGSVLTEGISERLAKNYLKLIKNWIRIRFVFTKKLSYFYVS